LDRNKTREISASVGELIILDEADDFILDSSIEINAPDVVGLTATALDDLEDDAAKTYLLKYMGFAVYDSAIPSDISTNIDKCSRQEFVAQSEGMARLIYTSIDNYAEIRDLFKGKQVTLVPDENASDKLREMESNHVFYTSVENYMRAYDYRSKEDSGIALFLDTPLSCKRTLIQALGRVGRYAQRCKRFVKEGIEPVDREMNAKIKATIAAKIQGKLEAEAARKRDVKAAEKEAKRQTRAAAKMQ
jgi:hypothetical protein